MPVFSPPAVPSRYATSHGHVIALDEDTEELQRCGGLGFCPVCSLHEALLKNEPIITDAGVWRSPTGDLATRADIIAARATVAARGPL